MKNIQEIRQMTKDAKALASKRYQLRKIREKERKKQQIAEQLEEDKDVSHYFETIEKAAKKGKSKCEVSLGDIDQVRELHKKYIKKSLAEFNPQFENEPYTHWEYDYEGGRIHGSDTQCWRLVVKFSW